ncbi:MAG: hypothetical protein U9Q69_03885 [Nanoarchaeota archaeon]|nr:hypothetical protein [Nanoarchaeota archaeon]
MKKRGQIWISAVLYLALGVIVLTIVLSAGVPLIQKMKDKNIVTQTKNIFFTLDENVKAVVNEGPGARRYLSPFEIKAGDFYVDNETSRFLWNYTSSAKLLETDGFVLEEGAVKLQNYQTLVEDEFIMNIALDYSEILQFSLNSEFQNPFSGIYSLAITNTGSYTDVNKPIIEIALTG